jgi:hypothetical protein
VLLNFKPKNLFFQKTHRPIELDIYIPSITLAFEYQGEQHYKNHAIFGSNQKERDTEKAIQCQQHGITLIAIPFWWNGTTESLVATIQSKRPDICKLYNVFQLYGSLLEPDIVLESVGTGKPIQEEMPSKWAISMNS